MASCNPSFGTTSVAPTTARNRAIVPRDTSARCQCARATARVTLLAQIGNEGNAEPSRPHAAALSANSGATSDEKTDQCQKAALRLGTSLPGRCPAVKALKISAMPADRALCQTTIVAQVLHESGALLLRRSGTARSGGTQTATCLYEITELTDAAGKLRGPQPINKTNLSYI